MGSLRAEGSPREIDALADHLAGFPDAFAGLVVVDAGHVRVWLVRSVDFDRAALRQRFRSMGISSSDARFSRARANQLRDRISAELPEWRARGIRIMSLEIDDVGRVLLGVEDPASGAGPLLDTYGADRLRVEAGEELDDLLP